MLHIVSIIQTCQGPLELSICTKYATCDRQTPLTTLETEVPKHPHRASEGPACTVWRANSHYLLQTHTINDTDMWPWQACLTYGKFMALVASFALLKQALDSKCASGCQHQAHKSAWHYITRAVQVINSKQAHVCGWPQFNSCLTYTSIQVEAQMMCKGGATSTASEPTRTPSSWMLTLEIAEVQDLMHIICIICSDSPLGPKILFLLTKLAPVSPSQAAPRAGHQLQAADTLVRSKSTKHSQVPILPPSFLL